MAKVLRTFAAVVGAFVVSACTVHKADTPNLSGPSDFALSYGLTASPDSIVQDGSQSVIRLKAYDALGKPLAGQEFRLGVTLYGSSNARCGGATSAGLSAGTIATQSDGNATAVFTAPASSELCNDTEAMTGAVVSAVPVGTNFSTEQLQSVSVAFLHSNPVIIPTAVFAGGSTTVGRATLFDGSASCGGPISGGVCPSNSPAIGSYAWDFGDGGTGSGKQATHTYTAEGSYRATLTVTNVYGISASATATVTVTNPDAPTADFSFSPAAPAVNDEVYFNASASTAAAGHSLVSYVWDYGDGTVEKGVTQSHDFVAPGTYNVTLTVTDDAGQTAVVTKSVSVSSGAPTAKFTMTRAGSVISVDGSASTAVGSATISTYAWNWGDQTSTAASAASTAMHDYSATLGSGTYTVTLTIVDSLGRIASTSLSVTIP